MIQTFDITMDSGMLPIMLHQNNLRPMHKKWRHREQVWWWTHPERLSIMEQLVELQRNIQAWYQVVATLASQVAISAAHRSGGRQKEGQKPKKDNGKPAGLPVTPA